MESHNNHLQEYTCSQTLTCTVFKSVSKEYGGNPVKKSALNTGYPLIKQMHLTTRQYNVLQLSL